MALVYDVADTEGRPLPEDVASFYSQGPVDAGRIASFIPSVERKNIDWCWIDAGDQQAGSIRVLKRAADEKEATEYRMQVNRNHAPAVQFTTVAHELGHLFLGHLGPDKQLNVPERASMNHTQIELEAESVAFIVCARNNIRSKSETYLANYVKENPTVDQVDVYQVMRATGQVEALLGLTAHTRYQRPNRTRG